MTDPRFVTPPRGKDCLNCEHHGFDLEAGSVTCSHPKRPNVPVKVERWKAGCAQHEPKKDPK